MRLRVLSSLLLSGGLFAATAAPAAAQERPEDACYGKSVVSLDLRVVGHPDYPQTTLGSIVLRVQEPFTRDANKRSIDRLIRLSNFEKVWVTCAPAEDGARITFHAEPPHPVTELAFEGQTGMLEADLRKRVLERYNGMPVGVPPELVKDAVVVILNDHGFLGATATVTRETSSDPDRSTLTFDVAAGSQARVGTIKIENSNPAAVTNARIRTMTGLAEGGPYQPGPLNESLQELVTKLRSEGYYTAAAFAAPGRPAANGTFDVDLTMSPGPLIVLEWDKTGDPPPAGDIDDFIPIKARASIDQDLLTDSINRRIVPRLQNDGFADAAAEIISEDTPGKRVLKVRITRGPKYRVDHVELPTSLSLTTRELLDLLQVNAGDDYRRPRVLAGLLRIQQEYLARGFYKVLISSEPLPAPNRPSNAKERWVVLQPKIVEGPRGRIVDIVFERATTLMPTTVLLNAMQGKGGEPYMRSQDTADAIALEATYVDYGFRNAKVRIEPKFSAEGRDVQRIVHIEEGVQVRVADVQIVGWHDISERAIREEMTLRPGDPFSESRRLESQTRLYNMGVFRQVTVDVDPDRPLSPQDTGAHVLVRVVEAPDTSIAFGGGVEAGTKKRLALTGGYEDRIEFAPRGSFEWSRRNLGGRNRTLQLATRVSLRPRDEPNDPLLDGRGYRFSEYRLALGYQERRAFNSDTDWLFSATSEQAIRTTFNFVRHAGNVEFLRRLSLRTTANARYTIEFTRLFDTRFTSGDEDEALDIDRAFPQVRLSSFSLSLLSDRRDEAVAPKRGTLFTGDVEIAARAIGSEVGYIKTYLQGSTYRRLSRSDRFVFATRGILGLAHGFDRPATDVNGNPITIEDLPASERFFTGGSTTVRGFQLDSLGTPQVLTVNGLSLGGNGLVVLNAELRTIVGNLFGRKFTVVEFVDAGNVFAKAKDIRLGDLRASVGLGVRYDSPVGPLRLDFGRKLERLTFNGKRESAWEFHISFGEVF